MCLMVYIASDVPLPLIPWDERHRFNVSELEARYDSVRKQFTKPHVFMVGSHTGCGCGFESTVPVFASAEELQRAIQAGSFDPRQEPSADPASKQSRAELAEYLRKALTLQTSIELYACWEGEEGLTPASRAIIEPDDIEHATGFLDCRVFAPVFVTVVSRL